MVCIVRNLGHLTLPVFVFHETILECISDQRVKQEVKHYRSPDAFDPVNDHTGTLESLARVSTPFLDDQLAHFADALQLAFGPLHSRQDYRPCVQVLRGAHP